MSCNWDDARVLHHYLMKVEACLSRSSGYVHMVLPVTLHPNVGFHFPLLGTTKVDCLTDLLACRKTISSLTKANHPPIEIDMVDSSTLGPHTIPPSPAPGPPAPLAVAPPKLQLLHTPVYHYLHSALTPQVGFMFDSSPEVEYASTCTPSGSQAPHYLSPASVPPHHQHSHLITRQLLSPQPHQLITTQILLDQPPSPICLVPPLIIQTPLSLLLLILL